MLLINKWGEPVLSKFGHRDGTHCYKYTAVCHLLCLEGNSFEIVVYPFFYVKHNITRSLFISTDII